MLVAVFPALETDVQLAQFAVCSTSLVLVLNNTKLLTLAKSCTTQTRNIAKVWASKLKIVPISAPMCAAVKSSERKKNYES